jgi:hypothetical protein
LPALTTASNVVYDQALLAPPPSVIYDATLPGKHYYVFLSQRIRNRISLRRSFVRSIDRYSGEEQQQEEEGEEGARRRRHARQRHERLHARL